MHELYETKIKSELRSALKLGNVMEVPRLKKIVINVGVKEAVGDSKAIQAVMDVVGHIAGQRPVKTLAKKSIASFKIREDMALGVMVTLRKRHMYEFLDRLTAIAMPRVRDFKGISDKGFDGRGNYTFGVKEQIIFPEISIEKVNKITGMDITFVTSTNSDEESYELLKALGMPFTNANKQG